MLSEIWTIKGKNPCAIYVYDGSIKCIIEENKIKNTIDFIKAMFKIKECKITELENDDIIKNLPHPYYGIAYDKNYIFSLVQKSGLHYELYLHDPKNPKFTTPSQFFGDVANLIKSGKRVGWFQNKWRIGEGIDLNRCIIEDVVVEGELKIVGDMNQEVKNNNLFNRLIECTGCFPKVFNLNAYNPQEAIAKLKNKDIDILVIANIIVARKKEDLEVK